MELGNGKSRVSLRDPGPMDAESLLRARAVCRSWDKAASSPFLLKNKLELSWARAHERMLFVVGLALDYGVASCIYDPVSARWYKLQLPPKMRQTSDGQEYRYRPSVSADLEPNANSNEEPSNRDLLHTNLLQAFSHVDLPGVSAGGGVLVSISRGLMGAVPFLGNPVARSWARLPALPGDLQIQNVRGMFVDEDARRFKLVAVETRRAGGGPISTFIFDSAWSDAWSVTRCDLEVPEPHEGFTRRFHNECHQGVFVGGGTVLYNLTRRCNLLTYDVPRVQWSWSAVARPRHFRIVSCKGPVQVCQLDLAGMTWRVVAAMPVPTIPRFMGPPSELDGDGEILGYFSFMLASGMKVVAGLDALYIMNDHSDQDQGVDIVALDLRQTPAAWRWLPSLPYKDFVKKSLHCVHPWLQFGSWIRPQESD